MHKYKNIIIEETPSEKYPTLVTMTKTPKNKSELLGRKFISLTKAIVAVDAYIAENLIEKGSSLVKKELESLYGMQLEVEG